MTISLPTGYLFRPPGMSDAQGVAELIAARDIADYGSTDANVEEVQNYWEAPRFDLAQDARIIVAPDGLIVGYEEIYPRSDERLEYDGFVHPRENGRGFGTLLLRWAEERAHERVGEMTASGSVIMRGNTAAVDQNASAMFKAEGFALVRQFWRMEIEMTSPPDRPTWPVGITLRTMQIDQDARVVHAAIIESFADHWGYIAPSFEEWSQNVLQSERFDPALTFMAFDGDDIAGVVVNRHRDIAWVGQLAVRSAWRKRGLGLALLLHSFNEFYRRGDRAVGLGVDAQNLTGATRLYEKAGMHVTRQYDTYEKILRDA
jgi:mycothiol synthase